MSEFINTIEAHGDDAVIDSIIERTIVEFRDDSIKTIGTAALNSCPALETVDVSNVTTLGQYAFNNSNLFATLILRKTDAICTMPYANTVGSGVKVYVPSALVEEYKVATNWSAIANNIYAIEDYPEITGG